MNHPIQLSIHNRTKMILFIYAIRFLFYVYVSRLNSYLIDDINPENLTSDRDIIIDVLSVLVIIFNIHVQLIL